MYIKEVVHIWNLTYNEWYFLLPLIWPINDQRFPSVFPINWSAEQINWLVSIWSGTLVNHGLRIYLRIGKNVFHQEKLNFEHIGNYVHTTKLLALIKALNIYINYSMFYPDRLHVKWKHFKYTNLHSTLILHWFHHKQRAKF